MRLVSLCLPNEHTCLFSIYRPLPESTEYDTAVFLVKGIFIGQTSVSAHVMDKDGRKMTSTPQPIEVLFWFWVSCKICAYFDPCYSALVNLLILGFQVFPPFKLIPRKMTLLIGAMMQVCLKLKLHFQTAGLCLFCQMTFYDLPNEASAKTPATWCLLNCAWFELQVHFSFALTPSLKSF